MISKEKFLELASAKYEQINSLTSEPTMLDYERGLRDLMNSFTLEVMQEQLGGEGKDRRKKKNKDDLRRDQHG